jgi:hypothetical protein
VPVDPIFTWKELDCGCPIIVKHVNGETLNRLIRDRARKGSAIQWWMAGSAATLGVSSTFKGTVIANGAAVHVLGGTALDRTLVEGRLFSHAAAATVDTLATVTVPQ